MKVFYLTLAFLLDQAPTRCSDGCSVTAQCEALAQSTELEMFPTEASQFLLLATDVVTANPHPENYQLEFYGYGTTSHPGHQIVISYGFQDDKNETGTCEIQTVDGKPYTPN